MQFLALLLLAASAYGAVHEKRLINGQRAAVGQFPYMVQVLECVQDSTGKYNYKHVCGGAFYDPGTDRDPSFEFVLTAARCIRKNMCVRVGYVDAYSTQYPGKVYKVDTWRTHDQYNETDKYSPHDIAILTVFLGLGSTRMQIFDDHVKAAYLPRPDFVPGNYAILTGWGDASRVSPTEPSKYLMYMDVPIIDNNKCRDALRRVVGYKDSWITESHLCTLHATRHACPFDEGSPLVQQNVIVGIVTWVLPQCGLTNYALPTVYTNVTYNLEWITSTTRNMHLVSTPQLPQTNSTGGIFF